MSRLIIKNLPKNFTEDKIRKLFSQKGDITDIQLKYTSDGKFRQFGFVGYRTEEQAQEAIKFFNNSFVQTSKIRVEVCAQLGDESKPKAWSKYASDSSAFKKEHKTDIKDEKETNIVEEPKEPKKNKIKELVEKYKDDPMFEEFMQLHGTKDIKSLLDKLEESEKKLDSSETQNDQVEDDNEDSGHESTEENEEKVANKKISDLEYMKMLMSNSGEIKKEPRKKMEKKPKEEKKLFTVKIRGLPYVCKKKDIKEFFKPNIPYTVRLPAKIKGIAYVTFKTEKKMNQALIKDKSFLGGKRIAVFKHSSTKETEEKNDEDNNPVKKRWMTQEESLKNEEDIAESGRIFIRNLAYSTNENDIQELFSKFGPITEVNLPLDKNTRQLKGFGIVTFLMPEHAVRAYTELDGSILQGRMLHLLPGKSKDTPDELTNTEGLSYKEKKALKEKATAGSSHNWNSLFMGHNAVADAIADTYGASKEQVLDGRGSGSAAVRLALGETQLVAQTKEFLEEMGVQLDAFNQPTSQRSKTVILAKNLPARTTAYEIQTLFAPFGLLGRVVLPPSGITALIEFLEPSEARKAFSKLAYTKFKNGPLYLEWAPENTFTGPPKPNTDIQINKNEVKTQKMEQIKEETKIKDEIKTKKETIEENNDSDEDDDPEPDTTLFVKNLNFTTDEDILRKHFEPCGKLNYVTVAMKKDPQNPGQKLSMGYGFVRFQRQTGANKALRDLQMSTLEGKSLEIKRSERTLQNEVKSTRKKTNVTKQNGTKILVRNIPFQANWNEINELFKAFGEIKALRLPKKLTTGAERHRGFAFVDFVTKSDAKRAFQALSQSTHLYGRRLVLEWASTEDDVEDIRKRTAKHFHQTEEVQSRKSRIDADTFISN